MKPHALNATANRPTPPPTRTFETMCGRRLTRHTNKLYYADPQELITLQGRARVAVVYITPEDRCDHWTGNELEAPAPKKNSKACAISLDDLVVIGPPRIPTVPSHKENIVLWGL